MPLPPPRAGRDRMVRVTAGPQAEPVVVFADQNDHLAAAIPDGADPLVRIERRRVENGRVFLAVAPLDAAKRVGAEVDEERPLQPHPGRLIGAGQDLGRLLGDHGIGIPPEMTCTVA